MRFGDTLNSTYNYEIYFFSFFNASGDKQH
jgi:hypothetical protein